MARLRKALLAGLALPLLLSSGAGVSLAAAPVLEGAPPVMQRTKMLEGRHIIAPMLGMTLDDPYQRNLMAGLAYRYFVASWAGLGVDIWTGGGFDTSLTEDINRELSGAGQPFQLSTSSLRLLANAALELIPLSGKAMVFGDQLVQVDLHINLGVGVALTSGTGRIDDTASFTPMFGLGMRLFPNSWLSIAIDLRDYLVNRALASRRDGSVPGASFGHNWQFGLSVGFSFPTVAEISE